MLTILVATVLQGQAHQSVFVPEDCGGERESKLLSLISTTTAEAKGNNKHSYRSNAIAIEQWTNV